MTRAFTRLAILGPNQHVVAGNYSGPLYGTYLGIFTAINPPASPDSLRTDITEATITGYARLAATWTGPGDSSTGFSELVSGLSVWTPSDAVNPNTIIGVALYDALTNGNLLGVDMLPNPVPLPNAFTSFRYVASFGLAFLANYSGGTLIP